ncbi:MAG: IS1595 family transposase [Desulfobacterales bacterium]|nr:IS1595 family transposase [Desulfobacterales bacterium]
MEDYPKTLLDFEERFGTEAACREYLFQFRWPEGFRCPQCGYQRAWLGNRGVYECASCGLQTSVIVGTIFQDTKKPLRLWFRAMWHITSQKYGANALGLQRVLGLGSYHTAWNWLHKLRRAMVRPGRDRLSGTVEVDEAYIGGEKPGKRGRGAAGKVLVVVATEVDGTRIGRIRLKRVADASAASLCPAVAQAVAPGTIVRTDGWTGYGRLCEMGYAHEVIRKDGNVGENLLPKVNRIVALLKRWLLGTYQGAVRPSHLDYYLDEYTFRFNRRTSRSRGKLFYRLVEQAVALDPIVVKDIEGGIRNL